MKTPSGDKALVGLVAGLLLAVVGIGALAIQSVRITNNDGTIGASVTAAGTPGTNALTVAGTGAAGAIPVTGTFSAAGVSDTIGASVAFNANAVCATVSTAGQLSVGFFLGSGTSDATYTPSVSEDATISPPGCSGGNWTPSTFVDISSNESPTLVTTNPNSASLYGIKTLGGTRCVKVCSSSVGGGTATGNLAAVTVPSPPPAAGANVTDRAGRLLGIVYGSQGQQLKQTATNFNLQSELAVGGTLIDPRAIRALSSGTDSIAAVQSGTWNIGNISGTVSLPTGAAAEAGHLATIDTSTARIPAQGQALAAASMPVVLTAIQQAALTPPAAIAGFALEAGHLATIDTSTSKIPSQGQALAAASMPVVLTAAQITTLTPLSSVAATQSGTWTMQPGNTANTTPWLFTISQGGNAATVSGAGALKVDGSAVTQPVSGTVTATVAAVGATGAAVPASAAYFGLNVGGNLSGAVGGHGTAASALRCELPTDGTGVVGLNAGSNVIGALTANQSVNLAQLGGASTPLGHGTAAAALRVEIANDGTGLVGLNAGSNVIGHVIADTGSTTAATQATAANFNAQVVGNAASAAADSGNPVKVGAVVQLSFPTAGTDTQRMNIAADKFGRLLTVANADRSLTTWNTITLTSASETTLLTAVASTFLDLTAIYCTSGASTANTITVRPSTALTCTAGGSKCLTITCPAAIGPCEGIVIGVPLAQPTVNNNWTIQASATTSVTCTAQAVQNK